MPLDQRLTTFVDETHKDLVRRDAEMYGISEAAILRRIVLAYYSHNKVELPSSGH